MWGFELFVMLLMIIVNSVFAAYEIALASITLTRLERLADASLRGAKDAAYMKQNMEASLAVIQLGITLVGAIAAAVGGAGAEETIAPWITEHLGLSTGTAEFLALTALIVPLTIVTIIFGELVPKVFALRNSERVCLVLSTPMRWFSMSVWPAVLLFESTVMAITSWSEHRMGNCEAASRLERTALQDLRASAAVARAARMIGMRQEGIILAAAEMQSLPVRRIMLPVEHISTLSATESLTDNLIAAHLDMHTRFPVVEEKGDPQSIIGYVNVKDLIATLRMNATDGSMRSIIRKLPAFSSEQPILECLEKLMHARTHIAIVRDEANRVVGMVSLEDIIEELVGEIQDEYDRLPSHISETGHGWTIGGGSSLTEVARVTRLDLRTDIDDGRCLSDWVSERLGRDVRGGDVVEANGARISVRKVRRKKLQEAFVQRFNDTSVRHPASR